MSEEAASDVLSTISSSSITTGLDFLFTLCGLLSSLALGGECLFLVLVFVTGKRGGELSGGSDGGGLDSFVAKMRRIR